MGLTFSRLCSLQLSSGEPVVSIIGLHMYIPCRCLPRPQRSLCEPALSIIGLLTWYRYIPEVEFITSLMCVCMQISYSFWLFPASATAVVALVAAELLLSLSRRRRGLAAAKAVCVSAESTTAAAAGNWMLKEALLLPQSSEGESYIKTSCV